MGKLTDILNGADYPERLPEYRFRPPTVQEVAAYCRERANAVDPRAFVDHYTAKGWRIGKTPMRDWRASVRTWEARDATRQANRKTAIRDVLAQHVVWDAWRDMPDGPEKYQAYLCSPEWGKLREIVTDRSGGKCDRCKVNDAASVHHLTYQRKYQELPEDLIHYCQGCHDYTHGKSELDPLAVEQAKPKTFDLSSLFGRPEYWTGDELLLCPVCGYDYSHIRDVFTAFGSDEYEAGIYGTTEPKETTDYRRSALVIVFDGECGHTWRIVFQQHKGKHFCWAQTGVDSEQVFPDDSDEPDPFAPTE